MCEKSRKFSSDTSRADNLQADDQQLDGSVLPFSSFCGFVEGPSFQLGGGKLANQTHRSVVGVAGSTVLLATVARNESMDSTIGSPKQQLTVEYRQRHHGVGVIPGNQNRMDNARFSNSEVLASRAVDRALRPLLLQGGKRKTGRLYSRNIDSAPAQSVSNHFHVHCSVQSYNLWPNLQAGELTGHPVALAINSSAAVMSEYLVEPVAASALAVLSDGTIVQDYPMSLLETTYSGEDECIGELLYAGTSKNTIMMEWTSYSGSMPERLWPDLLKLAHATLQPILDQQVEYGNLQFHGVTNGLSGAAGSSSDPNAEEETMIRASLGLSRNTVDEQQTNARLFPKAYSPTGKETLVKEASEYCWARLGDSLRRLFGCDKDMDTKDERLSVTTAYVHKGHALLSKALRGRGEKVMLQEVGKHVNEYLEEIADHELHESDYGRESYEWIQHQVYDKLMRRALWKASGEGGTRADGRGQVPQWGWQTIRPLQLEVPALPPSVHGSALFARGDTQVLCTVTLGPPLDGQVRNDPFHPYPDKSMRNRFNSSTENQSRHSSLPVGSLRFLRTQEELISDLNSRRAKADKDLTGQSGSLAEKKRFFLQYDFPAYSTGDVPIGSVAHNRRAVGHGALAERAILSVMPPPHVFPYTVRVTSEVTDSNGSSSMASVCGATLALLDASVPLLYPVAGVSVGLALPELDEVGREYGLLLDITGTEDHFGCMDFKVAGTREGVTAIQLDVKRPLPIDIVVQALELAKSGRIAMLEEMAELAQPTLGKNLQHRPEPKPSAPRVEVVRFHPERKRDLVGPAGVVLRQLEDRYDVSVDLTQEGQCLLFGPHADKVRQAKSSVMDLVADVVEGETYEGTVIEIKDFGVLVELLRNKEGLLHISEFADEDKVTRSTANAQYGFLQHNLRKGQKLDVMCIGVDPVQGSIKLSRKSVSNKSKR